MPARGTSRGLFAQTPLNLPWVIPDLAADFVAGVGITIATGVSFWKDWYSGYMASQPAVGLQPGAGRDSRGPYVEWDGALRVLNADAIASLISGDDVPFSLILAYTDSDNVGTRCYAGFSDTVGVALAALYSCISGTTRVYASRQDDSGTLKGTPGNTLFSPDDVIVYTFTGSNGYLVTENGTVTADQNVGLVTLDSFTIGARGLTQQWRGKMRRLLIYTRALDLTHEVDPLRLFLKSQWNI